MENQEQALRRHMALRLALFPEWQPQAWKEPICLPAWALSQMLVPGTFHIYFPNLQRKEKKNSLLTPADTAVGPRKAKDECLST